MGKRRTRFQQLFDNFEIKMGDRDHFAHNLGRTREDHFP
jgi:hypothetical protein